MGNTTITLTPDLKKQVEEYRDKYGFEQTSIAARRLIRIGLEQEAKK